MISRRTTLKIADYIYENYTESTKVKYGTMSSVNYRWERRVKKDSFKTFLYLTNVCPFTYNNLSREYDGSCLKDSILNMETGMFYSKVNYNKYQKLGQADLEKLAVAILNSQNVNFTQFDLYNSLVLDGYEYKDKKLYNINSDLSKESDLLKKLFTKNKLSNETEFIKFYDDMNEHFSNSKWEDSIHNGRKVLELVLKSCALFYQDHIGATEIADISKPVDVRRFLEMKGFFSSSEIIMIKDYYGYISNIGSHPKLASDIQAKLSMVLTINISLYTIQRLEEMIK